MNIDANAFREEIIESLGLGALNPERQDALIDKAVTVLLERIFLRTMERLGDSGVRAYESLLAKEAGASEMEVFFEAKIPGYNGFVQKIVEEFKAEMKSAER